MAHKTQAFSLVDLAIFASVMSKLHFRTWQHTVIAWHVLSCPHSLITNIYINFYVTTTLSCHGDLVISWPRFVLQITLSCPDHTLSWWWPHPVETTYRTWHKLGSVVMSMQCRYNREGKDFSWRGGLNILKYAAGRSHTLNPRRDYTTNLAKMAWRCLHNDVHLPNLMWKVKLTKFAHNKNWNLLSFEAILRRSSLTAQANYLLFLYLVRMLRTDDFPY